jgi:hypothetical protein
MDRVHGVVNRRHIRVHGGLAGGIDRRVSGRRACWSRASGHYGARELAGGGGKERGEHMGPFAGLTGARVVVLRSGNGDEVVVGVLKLGGRGKGGGEGAVRSGGARLLL